MKIINEEDAARDFVDWLSKVIKEEKLAKQNGTYIPKPEGRKVNLNDVFSSFCRGEDVKGE